jgi:hypothetical protein
MMAPDNRVPLSTIGLPNLLIVINSKFQDSYHRSRRFERDAEQLAKDTRALSEKMAAFRAALKGGDIEALLAMVPAPVVVQTTEPKDMLALHARQFAASRAPGRR